MSDLALLSRYPFLPQAGDYIEKQGPALDDLLGDRVYAGARLRGRARVLAALGDGQVLARAGATPREQLEDLLAYVYARILVSATKDAYVVRRHALAEAVRVKTLLDADDVEATARAAAALGLAFEPDGDALHAHFTEYLRFATHLKDMEWKLVRQPLRRGVVEMERATASRLVQEALRRRIETELPKPLSAEVVEALADDLEPLREAARVRKEKMQAEGFGEVDLRLMPPCMHHILAQLQQGENVAHSGRFAITSFLHTIGMQPEEIMKLFAQAPDFREDMTRYQVEHITGVTSGTSYSPPSCQAMQTFGICYNPDDTCRDRKKDGSPRVTHPLHYYRYQTWRKEKGYIPPASAGPTGGSAPQIPPPTPRSDGSKPAP